MSEKIRVNKHICNFSISDLDGLIEASIQFLKNVRDEAENKGFDTISIDVNNDGDDVYCSVSGFRLETDKEFDTRVRREAKVQAQESTKRARLELQERQQLTRLLLKYGNEVPPIR